MTRVLVLGATGDQGHPLLTRLMDAGFTPVAALRNPDALQGTEFAHVETVQADLYVTIARWRASQATFQQLEADWIKTAQRLKIWHEHPTDPS